MDKQIIIDETNISKCEFCVDSEYCYIYSGTADFKWMCKENEDCQIKNLLLQLKRKEQECERLKEDNKALCERIVKLDEEIENQKTAVREYERRWLCLMGY